ncbi:hypothetical protein IG631_22547 [Alternaria alternata]|nr:hypothetical protein IG631_22547 [Alternaria alternata]
MLRWHRSQAIILIGCVATSAKRQAASSLCLALALRTNAFAVFVTASRSTITSASSKPLLSPHPTQKLLPASELPQLPELSSQPPMLLRCFEPQYGSRCCSCLLVKRWERRLYLLRSILNFEFSEHSTHAHRRLPLFAVWGVVGETADPAYRQRNRQCRPSSGTTSHLSALSTPNLDRANRHP